MPQLLRALKSPSVQERRAATNALGQVEVESGTVIARLLAVALDDLDPTIRIAALSGLARNRSPEAIKAQIELIEKGDVEVRKGAMWFLTTPEGIRVLRGTPEAEALKLALHRCVDDPDLLIREDAARGLRALEAQR